LAPIAEICTIFLDAGFLGAERDDFGATCLHGGEFLRAALEQDADAVDHHIGALHRLLHRHRGADIGLHDIDLADRTHRLEEQTLFGAADGDADAGALTGQLLHDIAADEAGTAEHGDELVAQRRLGHWGTPLQNGRSGPDYSHFAVPANSLRCRRGGLCCPHGRRIPPLS
jgi:hypothetical protein